MSISVRALEAQEWLLLKTLRLAALQDDPNAFSPTFADEQQHPDSHWQQGAERFTRDFARMFIGSVDAMPMGLISAVRDRTQVGHLGAFWTCPNSRGSGLGSALFDTAMQWLEANGCHALELSVTEANGYGEAMYTRRGFVRTGKTEPLRPGSALVNVYMTKRVTHIS